MTGGCYGYSVTSTVDLRYLRDSGPLETLEVSRGEDNALPGGEVVLDWPRRPHRPVAVRLHQANGQYGLWIEDAGWFRIDPRQRTIRLPAEGNPLRTEERLWGMPSLLTFLADGDLPLHAGAVEIDGRAIIFTAPSRFGKTTLSAALWSKGYRLLTEDLCRIRFLDGAPYIYPGPAMLRMRHDVADALALPNVARLGEDDDRVHFALEEHLRGDAAGVPVAAIAFLREGDEVAVTPVARPIAIRDLWVVTFHLPDADPATFSRVADLVAAAPTWDLVRPLRVEALDATVDAMAGLAHAD